MLVEYVVFYLPATILLLLSFSVLVRQNTFSSSYGLPFFIAIIMTLAIAAVPYDFSIDKPRYVSMFYDGYAWGMDDDFKDPGWALYVVLCARLFNGNVDLFFFLTAFAYVMSYFAFAKCYFGKSSIYFIVMAMGCLGFTSYATNTIRAGFAIALLLFALSTHKKPITVLLMVFAIMLHRSMVIPIAGYILTFIIKKNRLFYVFWGVCLVLSIVNFDLSSVFGSIGFVDDRIEVYGQSINAQFSDYKKGFRIDFLIYSVIPVLIALSTIKRHNIKDAFISKMLNVYLFSNAIWLLAIRIAYSDRLAYLSWFLIPLITLYPVIKYNDKYKNPNALAIGVMWIFMGLKIVLGLR